MMTGNPRPDARVTLTEYRYRPMAISVRRRHRDHVTRVRYYGHKRHPPRREEIPEGARDNIASDVRSHRYGVSTYFRRARNCDIIIHRYIHTKSFIISLASLYSSIINLTRE